jgi:N-acetylglucosaminyl-diphospho-decaprenol L-rhamnosyltransferase
MISFVMVNYNTRAVTYRAIESIIMSSLHFDYEIILVDNNSTDGSKEFFEALDIPGFKYIYLDANVGFGKANNIGVNSCGNDDYIYIINSDTTINSINIESVIKNTFDRFPAVGILATKVQYEDGALQTNVQRFTSLKTVFLRLFRVGKFIRGNKFLLNLLVRSRFRPSFLNVYIDNFNVARREELIDWASGCSLIFKRSVYDQLNGFDENFFMYCEDEELCYRAKLLGYGILFTPNILITHYEGKSNSSADLNDFLVKTKVKSEFYYYRKHFPEKLNLLMFIYFISAMMGFLFSRKFRIIGTELFNYGK